MRESEQGFVKSKKNIKKKRFQRKITISTDWQIVAMSEKKLTNSMHIRESANSKAELFPFQFQQLQRARRWKWWLAGAVVVGVEGFPTQDVFYLGLVGFP